MFVTMALYWGRGIAGYANQGSAFMLGYSEVSAFSGALSRLDPAAARSRQDRAKSLMRRNEEVITPDCESNVIGTREYFGLDCCLANEGAGHRFDLRLVPLTRPRARSA
jgi:hypothetical protein